MPTQQYFSYIMV